MDEGRPSDAARAYWRANKILIAILLVVWAVVSHVFAIFMARPLYGIEVGGVPMSFWWAQQGSMVVFVILIFVYALVMDRLDEKYDFHEERPVRGKGSAATPAGPPAGQPPVGGPAGPGEGPRRPEGGVR